MRRHSQPRRDDCGVVQAPSPELRATLASAQLHRAAPGGAFGEADTHAHRRPLGGGGCQHQIRHGGAHPTTTSAWGGPATSRCSGRLGPPGASQSILQGSRVALSPVQLRLAATTRSSGKFAWSSGSTCDLKKCMPHC